MSKSGNSLDNQPPRDRRWSSFRLRTLLVLLLLAALPLASWARHLQRLKRRQAACDAIRAIDGRLFDHGDLPRGIVTPSRPTAPAGWRRLLGEIAAENPTSAEIRRPTDATFVHLGNLPDLESLRVEDTMLRGTAVAGLAGLVRLDNLSIKRSAITREGARQLRNLSHLDRLSLEDCPIEIGSLNFRNLSRLRWLSLNRVAVRDKDITCLVELIELESLSLNNTLVTDLGMPHLRNLRSLRHLSLKSTAVTDSAMIDLAKLESLRELDLSGTKVTMAGIAHLARLSKLEVLKLDNTRVRDFVVPHLERLQALRQVHLRDSDVTWWGFQQIQQKMPHVLVFE